MNKLNSFNKFVKSIRQFALALIAWILFSLNTQAQFVNIPVTGFNNDVVANGTDPGNTATTGTIPGTSYPAIGMDGSAASTFIDSTYRWYPGGLSPTCFLPTSKQIPSAITSGLTYQLQNYSAANALTVASNVHPGSVHDTVGTVNLVTPATYQNLYVLYTSIVRPVGPATIIATVTFTDASTQVFSDPNVLNWFDNVNRAYMQNVSRARNLAPGDPEACNTGPYLYQMSLALNPANYSKAVASISFKWLVPTGNSASTMCYLHVMAVGGQATNTCNGSLPSLITVGPGETYTTLSGPGGVLAAINANGITQPTVIELKNTYTAAGEVYPITINLNTCFSATKTLTIRPDALTASPRIISSADTNATFDLNGAQYVIIDGRPGGLTTNKYLEIRNTSFVATASGKAILLRNDASYNILRYLDVKASNKNPAVNSVPVNIGTLPGAIAIGSTNKFYGNDNNLITFCNVHSVTATDSLNVCIYAGSSKLSSDPASNDSLTISNCNIYDFYNPATASSGINVSLGNNRFKIENNSLYQTVTRNYTSVLAFVRPMWLTPATGTALQFGGGYTISGNIIGGSAPGGVGMYKTTSTGTTSYTFNVIQLSVGSIDTSSVQNNTITNLEISGGFTGQGVFGISIDNGNVNVGTETGNLIGSTSVKGAIKITSTATTGSPAMVGYRSAQGSGIGTSTNFSNNTVAGIDMFTTASTVGAGFLGISVQGGVNNIINNNTIGSPTMANSIDMVTTNTTSTTTGVRGINCAASIGTNAITNNLIANINSNYSASGTTGNVILGITIGTNLNTTVTGNTIRNITNKGNTTGSGANSAIAGIVNTSASSSVTISGNKINTLKLTNPVAPAAGSFVQITGILMGASAGTNINVVDGNELHSFSVATITNNVAITGITCSTGVATYSNNMIRLGLDSAGNSITGGILLRGITKGTTGGNNFYHNSIYIAGTNVINSTNNSFAFQRGTAATAVPNDMVVNNIFVNNRSNASTGGKHYSVSLVSSALQTLNSNVYFGNGTGYFFGALGASDFPTLINNWIPGDVNSYFFDPKFINQNGSGATGNLHIDPVTPSIVEGTGIPVPSILNDFDNQVRSGLTPIDIGADAGNFTNFVCSGTPVIGSSSVTGASTICVAGTTTITVSGLVNTPGVTLQWQESSTPGGPYTNVIGGTGSVTFTTPPVLANTYYVCKATCTNGGGNSISTESLVSVISPIVTQTVPASRCGAGSVILNATAEPGATLNWYDVPSGGSPVAGTSFTTPIIGGTSDFYVAAVVTSPFACVGLRTPVTATLTPSIPISSVSSASLVCLGNSTALSASSTNDPNYSYSWTSIPAGFTATGPGPHFASPTASVTTYQVYAFDSSSQCGALSSQVVNATPNNLLVTATSTPPAVCYGYDAQLNTIPGLSSTANNYAFAASSGTFTAITGGTATSLATNENENISTAFNIGFSFFYGTTNYTTVQATSNGVLLFGSGRANTNTNDLATTTLTQRPGVAPLWDDLQCEFGIKYLVNGTPGSRVLTVEWLNMEWTANANNPVISFQVKLYENSNVIQFVYRQESLGILAGSASIGIMGTAANDFISLQNSGSSPTISTAVSTNTISVKPATGQVYTFTPPGPGLLNYAWTGTNLSANNIINPVAQNITGTETYNVIITQVSSGCTKSASTTVNMFPVPTVTFTTDLSNFYCENQNINFDADGSINGPGATTYSWSGPGFSSAVEDPTIFSAQVGSTGNYTVNYTDGNGCTTSDTQYLEVNPNPVVNVTTTPVSCNNYNDGTATLNITVQPTYNDYAILEGSNSGSSNPQTFTGYTDATYFYQVSELNTGCTSFGSFGITTEPNLPPTITCPGNMTVSNDPGMCGAYVNYPTPLGSDNCPNGLNTVLIAGPVSGGWFPIGTTVVHYKTTDDLGLTADCIFSVTVDDNEAPTYVGASTCPASFTSCNPVTWTAPLFQDNCPGLQVTSNHSPGVNFPIGVTPVTYTATDLKGNPTTCTFNVTVLDSSLDATGISSNRDFNNICNGGDVTLTVNGGHLGESAPGVPAQWKWYSGSCGTTPVGTGSSITVAPTSTTTYFVRAEGGCRTTGCVQITIIVSNTPPSGSPVFTTIPVQGAPGVTDVLSVAPVSGATFYQWFTTNGHVNSVLFNGNTGPWNTNVPTVNVSFVLPQQNYQLRVIAGNGCGRTNQSNTHIRGTVPAPTSMTGPTQACPASPVTYSISAIPNGSPVTYNWALVPTTAGTITMSANGLSATVVFNAGFGSAQVCANGISSFGLPGPSYCTTVTSSAPVPGAISGNPAPCSGNVIPEIYSITAVPSAISYSWTCSVVGATVVQAGNGLSASITFPATTFTGTVQVTASSSCGTSAPSVLNITNGVPGNPGAISGATGGLCGAQDVAFSVTTSNALSYLWTVSPGMSIDGLNNLNAVAIDFLPGFSSGTVSVEAFYACGSVVKTHPVSGTPSAPLVAPAALCANSFQTYFVTNLEPSTDYTWTTSGDITDEYCSFGSASNCAGYYIETGPAGGSFTVTATNTCGTASTTSDPCRVMAESIDMKLYPNPTNGLVTVELYSKMGGTYKVSITDLSGRQVLSQEFKAASGRNQQEIDLGFANAGMYLVYIKDTNGNIAVQKLSVE